MEKTVKVRFEKNGAAYGFGNHIGECAEISASKFAELEKLGKKAKTKIIVKVNDKEFEAYQKSLPKVKEVEKVVSVSPDFSEAIEKLKNTVETKLNELQTAYDQKAEAQQKAFDDKLEEMQTAFDEHLKTLVPKK